MRFKWRKVLIYKIHINRKIHVSLISICLGDYRVQIMYKLHECLLWKLINNFLLVKRILDRITVLQRFNVAFNNSRCSQVTHINWEMKWHLPMKKKEKKKMYLTKRRRNSLTSSYICHLLPWKKNKKHMWAKRKLLILYPYPPSQYCTSTILFMTKTWMETTDHKL